MTECPVPKEWFEAHDRAKERWEKSQKKWFVIDEQDDIVAADFDTEEECKIWIDSRSAPYIYYVEKNARVA